MSLREDHPSPIPDVQAPSVWQGSLAGGVCLRLPVTAVPLAAFSELGQNRIINLLSARLSLTQPARAPPLSARVLGCLHTFHFQACSRTCLLITGTHVHTDAHTHTHACAHVHAHTCTHAHTCIHTFTHVCICTHMHTHVHTCACCLFTVCWATSHLTSLRLCFPSVPLSLMASVGI